MKTRFSIIFFWIVFCQILSLAQPIPADSLYLGQTPPGNTPKKFNLSVSPGFAASERIMVSKDGKSIFYAENNGYETTSVSRIKYYSYEIDKWTGPFVLFENAAQPAFSVTEDTMYIWTNVFFKYSVKKEIGWTEPIKFNTRISNWHYLQVTNSGTFYAAMNNAQGKIGGMDWSKITITKTDTTIQSLGSPLNSVNDDMDFYISRDESYIIIATNNGMKISFQKKDGSWTNPKNLGSNINFESGLWGSFVSPDNKYLFYSRGTSLSNACTNWIRIDNLVDSFKKTNFIPYVKNKIANQTDSAGHSFIYTIPDSTFIDDDGNNTLTYSALLSNGKPLPLWLNFDAATRLFTGIPTVAGSISVKVTATDTAKASVSATFSIKMVGNPTSIESNFKKNIQVYPNPAKDVISISFGTEPYKNAVVEITNIDGKVLLSNTFYNLSTATIDLTGNSKGVYILMLNIDGEKMNKRILLE